MAITKEIAIRNSKIEIVFKCHPNQKYQLDMIRKGI